MNSNLLMAVAGLAFVAALIDAAVSDLRGFRIPNRVPLVLLAAFLPAAWASGMEASEALRHLGAGALVFAGAAALFALRVWGGGDAKLVPAVALWTGFSALPRFLAMMALAGGVVALVALAARRLPPGKSGGVRLWLERLAASGHVPYGLAIAVAGLDWWGAAILPWLAG